MAMASASSATINRTGLAAIVLAIWIVQLVDQPDLAETLPLRPGRMALAVVDLLAASSRCGSSRSRARL